MWASGIRLDASQLQSILIVGYIRSIETLKIFFKALILGIFILALKAFTDLAHLPYPGRYSKAHAPGRVSWVYCLLETSLIMSTIY